jgi:ATP-binding cassette, subfamily G (WHITE), member 2, PDR
MNGISFYMSPADIQGTINIMFSIFLVINFSNCVSQLIIPHFNQARSLFEARERNSKSYSWGVFITSHVAVELVWQTVTSVLIFASWYYPTGLSRNGDAIFSTTERGAASFIILWLLNLWSGTISQFFATAFDQPDMGLCYTGCQLYFVGT